MPLLLVDVPPLLDYPNHLARAYVLALGQQDAFLSQMYAPHWAIIPNLAVDLLLPPLLWVMPVHVAGRILLAIALLLPVVGTVLYSTALFGRRSYWSVAVGLVACNGLFLLGFVNFQLGIGLALICAAAWIARREASPWSSVAIGTISTLPLFFSHLMGLLLFLILLGSYETERAWLAYRQGGRLVQVLARRGVWLLPVLGLPLALYTASAFASVSTGAVWESGREKLIHAATSLLNYSLPLDLLSAGLVTAFLLTCAGLRLIRVPLASAVALGAVGFLYAVAPLGFMGTGYIDARFAVMFGLLLFAGLRPGRLSIRARVLVAVAVAALFSVRTATVAAVWYAHNRDLAELREAISPVEPGSRVLLASVGEDEIDPAWRVRLKRQYLSDGTRLDSHTAALVLIERHAFWPFLFAVPSQQPIELRLPYVDIAARTLGMPTIRLLSAQSPIAADLPRFPLEGQWSCCYDYVLLLEPAAGPEFSNNNLELLKKTDYASLYRVKHIGREASVSTGQQTVRAP